MIEAWLQDWFAGRGFRLDRTANLYDAGAIDSLGLFEMIDAIEGNFKFRFGSFQDRRLLFATIASLTELIDERLQQG